MAGTSAYLQTKLADYEFNAVAWTPAATVYVALLLCTNGAVARSTAYAVGNTASNITASGSNHLYKCTTAGTTAGTAPAYPGTPNEVITDGTAVFTEQTSALAANTAEVEPTGGGYARVAVPATTVGFTVAAPTATNAAIVTYPTPTAAWQTAPATIWGFATYDAASSGNLLRYGGLASDQSVATGNSVSFAIGQLSLSVDN